MFLNLRFSPIVQFIFFLKARRGHIYFKNILIRVFLVLFLLINANLILGQNHEKIDSFEKVLLQTENDSLKMKLNKSLGIMWEASNLDSSIFHYNQGKEIAKMRFIKQKVNLSE